MQMLAKWRYQRAARKWAREDETFRKAEIELMKEAKEVPKKLEPMHRVILEALRLEMVAERMKNLVQNAVMRPEPVTQAEIDWAKKAAQILAETEWELSAFWAASIGRE